MITEFFPSDPRKEFRDHGHGGAPAGGMVVAVVGATASGKSELALRLAEALDGEVISADSMQLYRGMNIGTGKLSLAERRGVPHHLLDIWDVTQTASASEYQRLARTVIADIQARGRTAYPGRRFRPVYQGCHR